MVSKNDAACKEDYEERLILMGFIQKVDFFDEKNLHVDYHWKNVDFDCVDYALQKIKYILEGNINTVNYWLCFSWRFFRWEEMKSLASRQ